MRRQVWLSLLWFVVGASLLYGSTLVFAATLPVSPTAADLQISKSAAPDPVQVGDPLTYTIVVRNVGPSIAFSLTIQDLLPTGVDFNGTSGITTRGAVGSNLLLSNKAVTITANSLQPGGIVTFTGRTLVGAAATGATLLNQATVNASNDDNVANNSATISTVLLPLPATATPTLTPTPITTPTPQPTGVDLRMTKRSTPDMVAPGQLLTYTILVRNVGSIAAQNLVITDSLPAGVSFFERANISVNRGLTPTLQVTNTLLTGRVPQLNPGGLITITSQTLVGLNVTGTALSNTAWMAVGKEQAVSRYSANVSTVLLIAPTPTPTPRFDPLGYKLYSPVIRR